jgi:uncharacterized protein
VQAISNHLGAGTPVTFDCEGSRLYGSLHSNSTGASDVGVILVNQGPVDRGGSHRLYIKLANRLTTLGVPVLRFDARGVGESEGAWATDTGSITVPDAYGRIQKGAWTPDALAAIDHMRRSLGVKRIVIGGLCGGAVTALFAGATNRDVAGIFAIGTPVTFSSVTGRLAELPDSIIQREARGYFYKMFYLESWRRFLTFKTDYRTLARLFAEQVARWMRPAKAPGAAEEVDEKVNYPLFAAIRAAGQARKPTLLVYGENDYLWQEFQEQMPRASAEGGQRAYDLVTIPDANHILTEEAWQESLHDAVVAWLEPLARRQAVRKLA